MLGIVGQEVNMYWQRQPWYKHRRIYFIGGAVLVLIAAFVIGGFFLSGANTTPIGDILSDPDRFNGQVVRIQGVVMQTFTSPLLGVTFLKVGDETGEIWCRMKTHVKGVTKGDNICVQGQVHKVFEIPLPGRTFRITAIGDGELCPVVKFMHKLR